MRKKRANSSPQPKKENAFQRKMLVPKSKNQADYIRCVAENDVTLCIGPAGSGKTAIATGLACESLMRNDVSKIIITRPVIESGKGLGFLPGTMLEKINPYMIPILEEMKQYLGDALLNLKATNIIEICPLEYMRGRNFHNAFMILDEAQNCTFEQIKMFITRIGQNSKVLINGDTNQSDIKSKSGLSLCINKLRSVNGIGISELSYQDIQRNGLIGKILDALEN